MTKEEQLEYNREWHKKNPEKSQEYTKKFRQKNPEYANKVSKEYYKKNSEKCREAGRKWKKDNPERVKETAKIWRENNKDKIRENAKRYSEENKELLRTKSNARNAKLKANKERVVDWLAIKYEGVPCMDCEKSFAWCAMDFDHKPGETKELKIGAVGSQKATSISIARVEKEIAKCDLICSNCHRVRTQERHDAKPQG